MHKKGRTEVRPSGYEVCCLIVCYVSAEKPFIACKDSITKKERLLRIIIIEPLFDVADDMIEEQVSGCPQHVVIVDYAVVMVEL